MKARTSILGAVSAVLLTLGAAPEPAAAAPIPFGLHAAGLGSYGQDGVTFTLAGGRVVNGNCLDAGCLALNRNETATLSFGGRAFSLGSLSLNLLGGVAELTLTGSNGATLTFTTEAYGSNSYRTVDLGQLFGDVTSVMFANTGRGNVRIDGMSLVAASAPPVAAVPAPPAGLALAAGLGVLAAAGRRRR